VTIERRALIGSLIALPLLAGRAAALGGNRGMVSLTYDDGLPCHLDLAVPALDRRDLRATFYVTLENIEPRAAAWAAIAQRGHELADHTVHHPCDIGRKTAAAMASRELRPIEHWLDQVWDAADRAIMPIPAM